MNSLSQYFLSSKYVFLIFTLSTFGVACEVEVTVPSSELRNSDKTDDDKKLPSPPGGGSQTDDTDPVEVPEGNQENADPAQEYPEPNQENTDGNQDGPAANSGDDAADEGPSTSPPSEPADPTESSAQCGQEDGFFEIYSAEDLDAVRADLSGKYRLCNDIDLSGVDFLPIGKVLVVHSNEWSGAGGPVEAFSGTFDGNGYSISNLAISIANTALNPVESLDQYFDLLNSMDERSLAKNYFGYIGFFRALSDGAVIKNLRFADASIEAEIIRREDGSHHHLVVGPNSAPTSPNHQNANLSGYLGVLAGYTRDHVRIQNVQVDSPRVNVVVRYKRFGSVGSLIGEASNPLLYSSEANLNSLYANGVEIKNVSVSDADIYHSGLTSSRGIGGVVGYLIAGVMKDSEFSGKIRAAGTSVGGIVGQANLSELEALEADVNIVDEHSRSAGGVVGMMLCSSLTQSFSSGSVEGNSSIGGLVGQVTEGTQTCRPLAGASLVAQNTSTAHATNHLWNSIGRLIGTISTHLSYDDNPDFINVLVEDNTAFGDLTVMGPSTQSAGELVGYCAPFYTGGKILIRNFSSSGGFAAPPGTSLGNPIGDGNGCMVQ